MTLGMIKISLEDDDYDGALNVGYSPDTDSIVIRQGDDILVIPVDAASVLVGAIASALTDRGV